MSARHCTTKTKQQTSAVKHLVNPGGCRHFVAVCGSFSDPLKNPITWHNGTAMPDVCSANAAPFTWSVIFYLWFYLLVYVCIHIYTYIHKYLIYINIYTHVSMFFPLQWQNQDGDCGPTGTLSVGADNSQPLHHHPISKYHVNNTATQQYHC